MPDDLDRQLLALLRRDARAPVAKLAAIVGRTRGTVQARIDRMQEAGAIQGFTLREGPGEGVRAVMLVEVAGIPAPRLVNSLRAIPEIHALHTTNGKYDFVAEIRAATLPAFDAVLRAVQAVPGVVSTQSNLLLNTL
ncbi:Lrp/AsnC family transcriptional regulator [Jannaschia sp. W003]|uniref:Lrp/AsnC family transcriptional regulator n=1 Tax=Jannaschia sp. W003 TaxID=2867012 RepID=UPI0021A63E79|nr:Lrp/AsnC family transcriptional regulator [Jannaschia sp. W003]UWQ21502.1 Lrp/AsnC family transcriptional regulator [Jannaschia sp. W003]